MNSRICLIGVIAIFGSHLSLAQTTLYDSIAFKGMPLNIEKVGQITYNYINNKNVTGFHPIHKDTTIKELSEKIRVILNLKIINHQNYTLQPFFNIGKHEKSTITYHYGTQHDTFKLGEYLPKSRKDSIDIELQQAERLTLPPHDTVSIQIILQDIVIEYMIRPIIPTFYSSESVLYQEYGAAILKQRPRTMLHFFILGYFVFQILWIAVQYIQLRQSEYLYYLAYIFTLFIYFYSKLELLDYLNFLFTYNPQWLFYTNKSLPLFAYLMYFRFFDKFFNVKEKYPTIYPFMKSLQWTMILALIVDIGLMTTIRPLDLEKQWAGFLSLVLVISSLMIGAYVWWQKRNKFINMVLIGTCCFIISGLVSFIFTRFPPDAQKYPLIHDEPLIFLGLGCMIEILFLSLALTYQTKQKDLEALKVRNLHLDIIHSIIKGQVRSIKDSFEKGDTPQRMQQQVNDLMMICDFSQFFSDHKTDNLGALLRVIKDNLSKHFQDADSDGRNFVYTFDPQLDKIKLEAETKQNLILFIYEAATNIIKHAQQRDTEINAYLIKDDPETIRIEIKDDGLGLTSTLGLDIDKIALTNKNYEDFIARHNLKSYGLKLLFEKANSLKGQLNILSDKSEPYTTQLTLDFSEFRG